MLTSSSTNPLTTSVIEHIALLPEYPRTSRNGYTYCVNIDENRATQKEVLLDVMQV